MHRPTHRTPLARLFLAVNLVLLSGWPARSAAQSAPTSSDVPSDSHTPPRVLVDFVALAEPQELDAKIASWFLGQQGSYESRQLERLDVTSLFDDATQGVHVFVTRPEDQLLRLFFVFREGALRRYLVRDIALPSGLDEVGLENAAQVVFSASLALWQGAEETPIERVTAHLVPRPEPAAAPEQALEPPVRQAAALTAQRTQPAPTPSTHPLYLVAAGGYAARYRGSEGLAHGPLLSLGIAQRTRVARELGIRVSGTLLLPTSVTRPELALELRGYSLALEPWLEPRRFGRVRPLISLAVGLDIVDASPRVSSSPLINPASPSQDVDPFFAPRLGAYFALGRLSLGVALDLTIQAVRRHYDVSEPEGRRPWIQAWRAQPGVLLQAIWGAAD